MNGMRLEQRRLNAEMAAFLRGRLPKAVSAIVRRSTFLIGSEIVRSLNGAEAGYPTPKRIDTGRYRAAWRMGVESVIPHRLPGAPESADPENPSRSGDGQGTTSGHGLTLAMRVDNNVEYGPYIEDGTERMAAGNHLARALLVARADIMKAIGKAIPQAWTDSNFRIEAT